MQLKQAQEVLIVNANLFLEMASTERIPVPLGSPTESIQATTTILQTTPNIGRQCGFGKNNLHIYLAYFYIVHAPGRVYCAAFKKACGHNRPNWWLIPGLWGFFVEGVEFDDDLLRWF
jgi:hypothetical protein